MDSVLEISIQNALRENSKLHLAGIAQLLQTTEANVIRCLPSEIASLFKGSFAQQILESWVGKGNVTTIIESSASIFEIKAPIPAGKLAGGYYNFESGSALHGHLKLDLIDMIAFVSRPFHGAESHFIGFFNSDGLCIFKIYLGRDENRVLLPEQVVHFKELKTKILR